MIAEAYIGALQVHGDDLYGLSGFTIGSPAPRPVVDVRPEDHGTVDNTRWYGPRLFELTGRIVAADQAELWDALDDLKAALALGTLTTIRFRRSGLAFLERATVRVASPVDVPLGAELADRPMLRFGVTLEAPDPRIYSDTVNTGSYDPTDAGAGGLDFPLDFPLTFGAPDGAGSLIVANEGTIAAPATLTVTGPVVNPELANETAGLTIYTRDLELAAGETVELDTLTRAVVLNGTTSRPDLVDVERTDWWYLLPGSNQLRLQGSGMSAGATELSVTFRNARI